MTEYIIRCIKPHVIDNFKFSLQGKSCEVLDYTCSVKRLHILFIDSSVPLRTKRQVVEKKLFLDREQEEKDLMLVDMRAVLQYYLTKLKTTRQRKQHLANAVEQFKEESEQGNMCILLKWLNQHI
jgi:hypothetical protein